MRIIKNKNIYQLASIIIFVIGMFFTYLIAELDDAPGFIFLGTAIVTGSCLFLFGIGSLIELTKTNNKILSDINRKLENKSKK